MERRREQTGHQPPQNPRPKLTVSNQQRDLAIRCPAVRRLCACILTKLGVYPQELAIYLVSKRKIAALHAQFFDDPSPTDCISFPLDKVHLGEIFVCPQIAKEYAPKTPYEETSLYIIHGILHLLGYDDIDPKDRAKMHRKQRKLLHFAKESACLLS